MLSYMLALVAIPCAQLWLNIPISVIKTSLLGTLHHRWWSDDVDSFISTLFLVILLWFGVSARHYMIKLTRHFVVTLVVSTGQTHNCGNLRQAIP